MPSLRVTATLSEPKRRHFHVYQEPDFGRLSGELSAGIRTEGPQMADGSGFHLMGTALGAKGVGVT